jgi:D-aminoacyl-tRNA deacylase
VRACIQRVSRASVQVDDEIIGAIDQGLLVLLGIASDDNMSLIVPFIEKIIHLRIFDDEQGKMNYSLLDVSGGVLVVSQFTLYADCSRGRRPSYTAAAPPEIAEPLYLQFVEAMRGVVTNVASGRFRAHMQIHLVNDGPVTVWLEHNAS